MTLRTRRCLFYSFVLIFVAVGIGVVFYSQGWRPIWQNNQLVFQKTGAIFIETNPKSVNIKINNKTFQDKSGLLQNGTLISHLVPKNYKIEIEKNGYYPWEKNLSVKSGLVSETGKVILIPKEISLQPVPISGIVSAFWENGQNFVFSSSSLYFNHEEPVKLKGAEFIAWSEDGAKFITKDSKTNVYYLYDRNNLSKPANLNSAFASLKSGGVILEIAFHPADSNKLIIKLKTGLYILDLNRTAIETITTKAVSSFIVKNPNIIYVSGDKIYSFGLLLKNNDLKFTLPEELTEQKISSLYSNGNAIFIAFQNNSLYIFNQQNPDGLKIADSVKKTAVSPDNKKLAFVNSNGLNIYFIENYETEIAKKAGDASLLSGYSGQDVKNIFWHKDSRHLFIETPASTAEFIEIDDRQPTNKYPLVKNILNSYYDQNSNRLYFIQKNKVYFVEI